MQAALLRALRPLCQLGLELGKKPSEWSRAQTEGSRAAAREARVARPGEGSSSDTESNPELEYRLLHVELTRLKEAVNAFAAA